MLELFIKYKPKNELEKRLLRAAIFLWNLAIYSIPLFLISQGIIIFPMYILEYYTILVEYLLKLSGIEVVRENNILIVRDYNFAITQDCIGYKSLLGLFAIIFATPIKNFKVKARFFLIFAPISIFANIIRVYSTISLFYYYNIDPKFIHDVIWAILVTGLIILLWVIYFVKNKNNLAI